MGTPCYLLHIRDASENSGAVSSVTHDAIYHSCGFDHPFMAWSSLLFGIKKLANYLDQLIHACSFVHNNAVHTVIFINKGAYNASAFGRGYSFGLLAFSTFLERLHAGAPMEDDDAANDRDFIARALRGELWPCQVVPYARVLLKRFSKAATGLTAAWRQAKRRRTAARLRESAKYLYKRLRTQPSPLPSAARRTKTDIVTLPGAVDDIFRKDWDEYYNAPYDADDVVNGFMADYGAYTVVGDEYQVGGITADNVHETLENWPPTAGGLDGLTPAEAKLLGPVACAVIALILNLIEEGAPWPDGA